MKNLENLVSTLMLTALFLTLGTLMLWNISQPAIGLGFLFAFAFLLSGPARDRRPVPVRMESVSSPGDLR